MLGDYQRIMPTMNYEYKYCKVSGQEGNGSLPPPPPLEVKIKHDIIVQSSSVPLLCVDSKLEGVCDNATFLTQNYVMIFVRMANFTIENGRYFWTSFQLILPNDLSLLLKNIKVRVILQKLPQILRLPSYLKIKNYLNNDFNSEKKNNGEGLNLTRGGGGDLQLYM